MKKTHIIGVILAVAVAAAGVAGFLWIGGRLQDAEAAQGAAYRQYQQLLSAAEQSVLTVTEDGVVIGDYTLEELHVLEATKARVDAAFGELDRMEPAQFAALSAKERFGYTKQTGAEVQVELSGLDLELPMHDLLIMPRAVPEDAWVEFQDGSFLVHDELPGTTLREETVSAAMAAAMEGMTASVGAPGSVRFEVTSVDCYQLPEKTRKNTLFDFNSMLHELLQGKTVTLDFHGETVTLGSGELEKLLYADQKGRVQVDEEALAELVGTWHETYQEKNTPYLFPAQVGGVKPIDFLIVDYEIDQWALTALMTERLVELETIALEVPWLCWRNGEAFEISDTYVEIDIPNQVMTYVKDGEVLVTTDVVTGASWGYPTPPGYYKVENKDTNCWLSGEDYNVHVDYWIGFIGYQIGIHDADWRTKFGGENYVKNGSHGCVNTPKAAVQVIFDNIEPGVPVLVYGK